MIRFIFNLIRRWSCVRDYQGDITYDQIHSSTKSHIIQSLIWSLLLIPLPFVHHSLVVVYPIVGLLHSVFTEILFQFNKEKHKTLANIAAQIWERGGSFIFLSPVWLGMFILSLILGR